MRKKIKRFVLIFILCYCFRVRSSSAQIPGADGFVNQPFVCRPMGLGNGSRESWSFASHLEESNNQDKEFDVGHYTFSDKQLQKKYKHAEVFGIEGNYNLQNAKLFKNAIIQHLRDPQTQMIEGIFRNNEVFHHFNSKSNINIMFAKHTKKFLSCWKLNEKQIKYIKETGKI